MSLSESDPRIGLDTPDNLLNPNHYINIVAFTLLFYDYLLTLEWEISRYWVRPRGTWHNWPTILFFTNRYGTLLGNIPIAMLEFWTTEATPRKASVCGGLDTYHQLFVIFIQIVVGVMLVLRIYALYERSKLVLGFLLMFGAGVIGLCVWGVLFANHTPKSSKGHPIALRVGCMYLITKLESRGLIISWSGMGLFDCMIFALTLFRTLSRRHPTGFKLLVVLLRDGSLYFGVMVMMNVGNILTLVIGDARTRGLANTATNIVSSILISRLMLNIRDPALSSRAASRRDSRASTRNRTIASADIGVFSTYLEAVSMPVQDAGGGGDSDGICVDRRGRPELDI